ncbi:type I-G CRISPR-associated protein Csb2 [Yinghuangia sp. YIM S10712]|uniref:type I-G CRISPR-associated protein Csb2 n=1 Tax=Yinghuangia sp. YIM S10712 TaxID=3436930 RepID=UPI003F530820
MITIAFEFPWRRYHATPWGRHVNEGAVELPPAPWRILRALYAAWKERRPDLAEAHVHAVLTKLAAPPLRYLIPPYQLEHTRHWYPDTEHRNGVNGGVDKAFDAFAVLGGDATIHIQWADTLDVSETETLGALLEALPYLGRADSLVEARLAADFHTGPDHITAVPLSADEPPPPGWTTVDLLAPQLPLNVETLTARTVDVRASKLLYPPDSHHLTYTLPNPGQSSAPPRRRHRATQPDAQDVTAIRLTVTGRVQPPLTDALPLAEAVRAASIKILNPNGSPPRASTLAGKNADGTPLASGQHQHAHFIPHDSDGDRRIDQLIIWIPGGLHPDELAAIHQLASGRRTVGVPEGIKGPRNLHLRIAAQGPAADILPAALTGPATVWQSTTAFTPTRHRKKGQDPHAYLLAEVTRELAYRGHHAPTTVQRIPGEWPLFTRRRWAKRDTHDRALSCDGLRIEFPHPITGPLFLGRHSHFGLGAFHAVTATAEPQALMRHVPAIEAECAK